MMRSTAGTTSTSALPTSPRNKKAFSPYDLRGRLSRSGPAAPGAGCQAQAEAQGRGQAKQLLHDPGFFLHYCTAAGHIPPPNGSGICPAFVRSESDRYTAVICSGSRGSEPDALSDLRRAHGLPNGDMQPDLPERHIPDRTDELLLPFRKAETAGMFRGNCTWRKARCRALRCCGSRGCFMSRSAALRR